MPTGIKGRLYSTEMGISELQTIPRQYKRTNIKKSGKMCRHHRALDKCTQPNTHMSFRRRWERTEKTDLRNISPNMQTW